MNSTTRFSNRVSEYVKYRPHYPQAIIDTLRANCHLVPNSIVADIGSGTGILAEMFLRNGNVVYAVEPNREMRQAAEEFLGGYPSFRSVAATAEDTTLSEACVDFITAGQAFHWFDREKCRVEFRRVLRPGGWVVIVWNQRRTDTPFLSEYEQLLKKHATDYDRVNHRNITDEMLLWFFGSDGFVSCAFPNSQSHDFEGIRGRLLSTSYVPARGQPGCAAMLDDLDGVFREHQKDGQVTLEYVTQMYYGRL